MLAALIGGDPGHRELYPYRGRYGRTLGVDCTFDGTDINGWMVRQGLSVQKLSDAYSISDDEPAQANQSVVKSRESVASDSLQRWRHSRLARYSRTKWSRSEEVIITCLSSPRVQMRRQPAHDYLLVLVVIKKVKSETMSLGARSSLFQVSIQ